MINKTAIAITGIIVGGHLIHTAMKEYYKERLIEKYPEHIELFCKSPINQLLEYAMIVNGYSDKIKSNKNKNTSEEPEKEDTEESTIWKKESDNIKTDINEKSNLKNH